jgi:uncharacterized protein
MYASTNDLSMNALANLDFTNPENLPLLKIIIPIQTILFFGLPAILFAYFAYKNAWHYIGFRIIKNNKHILLGVLAMIAGLYFVGLLAQWNKMIPMPQSWIDTETDYAVLTKSLLTMSSISDLLFTIIIIAFLPAVCEELLFRGCLQNILIQQFTKKNAMIAIIIAGTIFGLIHGQMQTVLPRIFLGIVLGYLYYWSDSIWVSIIAHFVNNGLQVVIYYLASKKIIDEKMMNDDIQVPVMYGLLSGAICVGILYMIYKSKQSYQLPTSAPIFTLDAEHRQEIIS